MEQINGTKMIDGKEYKFATDSARGIRVWEANGYFMGGFGTLGEAIKEIKFIQDLRVKNEEETPSSNSKGDSQ